MKKLLIVLFGLLAFQGYVFAESWEERAASKTPWSSDFPHDPACWNPPVGWNADNPWVVGKGDHEAYYGLANCFRACAANDTCYRDGWHDEAGASAACDVWGIDQYRHICEREDNCDPDSDSYQDGPPWWKVTIALKAITMIGAGNFADGKMYVIAWCE